MKRMRRDEGKVQAEPGGALAVLPVCVCGAGRSEPSAPAATVPPCAACGGSQSRAPASEPRERRHLQEFLSAFV